MAAEGSDTIAKRIIELDPYAILSNGDPSLLVPSLKSFLLRKLDEVAEFNPLFRGSDVWRSFSAGGFFSEDVVEDTETDTGEDAGSCTYTGFDAVAVVDDRVAELAILLEISVRVNEDRCDLRPQHVDDPADHRPPVQRYQALVGTAHACRATAGEDDAGHILTDIV